MSDNARDDYQDNSPKPRKPFFPADLPSWLSAGANIGILFVGVVGVWTTVRISGLEDYFRSELTVRNEQIADAELRLRNLQGETDAASQSIAALERQRTELASQNATLLETADLSQRRLAFNVLQTRVELAQAGTSLSPLDFYYRDEWVRVEAETANPGVDVLDAVLRAYANGEFESAHDVALASQLRARCLGAVQTPIALAAIEAALPEPGRTVFATNANLEEITQTRRQAQEQNRAYYESRRAYIEAVNERSHLIGQAAARGADALKECGRVVLDLPAR